MVFTKLFSKTSSDPRERLLKHYCSAVGGVMEPEKARRLLDDMAEAGEDPERIETILKQHLGELDNPLAAFVKSAMRVGGDLGELGWLPLEALVHKTTNGRIAGFKYPPELDHYFQRWQAKAKKAVAADSSLGPLDITPDAFIRDTRMGAAIKQVDGQPRGFKIPDVHIRYKEWVAEKLNKTPATLSNADFDLHPPASYMKVVQKNHRPHAILSALLGDGAVGRGFSAVERSPGKTQKWSAFFRRVERLATATFKADILDMVTSATALRSQVHSAYRARYGIDAPDDLQDWVRACMLHHIDISRKQADGFTITRRGQRALNGVNIDDATYLATNFDEAAMTQLTGPKLMREGLHPEEFLQRMLDSHEILDAVVTASGRTAGRDTYQAVDGMFELVQKVVSRAGFEKGYVFELEMILDLADELGADEFMVLQLKLASKDGPDMILVRGGKASIHQAKSLDTLYQLYGFYGEAFRQSGSDLRRILTEFDPSGSGTGIPKMSLPGRGDFDLDPTMTYMMDKSRIRSKRPPPMTDAEWLAEYGTQTSPRYVENGITVYPNVDVDPLWLQASIQRAEESFAEINGLLANTATLAGSTARTAILAGSGRKLTGSTDTLASKLTAAFEANQDFTIAEAMALRMLVNPSTGVIDDKLIAMARRVASFNPPVRIEFQMKAQQAGIYEGANWDKLIGSSVMDHAEQAAGVTDEMDALVDQIIYSRPRGG